MRRLSESTARTSALSGDAASWWPKPKSFFVLCTSITDWGDHSTGGAPNAAGPHSRAHLYVVRSSVCHVYVVVSDSLVVLKQ